MKFRNFNFSELLINGYLALKDVFSSFSINKKLVFYIIDTFESNTFSKNVIEQLNKHVQFYNIMNTILVII